MPQAAERTTKKHREQDGLTPKQRDRRERIAALAERVFGDPAKAERWLRQPKRALDNETPLACAATEGKARRVEDMLYQIQHGMVV